MRYQLKIFVMFGILLPACSLPVEEAVITAPAPPQSEGSHAAASEPVINIDASVPVIVMLGDSLTAGYGLQAGEALPEQLEIALRGHDVETHFINAGVSGDTTAGGLARYDWSVASAKPDVLIVALGANDYLRGIPAEQAKANLAAILERAEADGLETVLVGLQPRGSDGSDPQAAAYERIYRELVEQYDVPTNPKMMAGLRGRPDLLQADRLHPTAEGVTVMAGNLADFLAPIISEFANDEPN